MCLYIENVNIRMCIFIIKISKLKNMHLNVQGIKENDNKAPIYEYNKHV